MTDDDELYRTIGTYVVPQLLYVAARLGIAELLVDGPLAVEELAARSGAHAPSLARALRALASVGVFARTREGHYRMTAAAEPLLRDHPRSRRAAILFAGGEQHRAWGSVMHSLTTGQPAFDHAFGEPLAAHLARHDEVMADAEALRSRRTSRRNLAIADRLELGRVRSIVDVGGGGGELLALLLTRWPDLRGVLFEAPHVAARARTRLEALGVADRCEVVAGDARAGLPGGHDAYLLAEVVHCHEDDDAREILRRCAGRRVYVVERVLGRASADCLADLHMLVMFGGRERTRKQYAALFEAAGLRLRRVLSTSSWVSILEAAPTRK